MPALSSTWVRWVSQQAAPTCAGGVVQVPAAVEEVDLRAPRSWCRATAVVSCQTWTLGAVARPASVGDLRMVERVRERRGDQVVVAVVVLQPGVGALLGLDRVGVAGGRGRRRRHRQQAGEQQQHGGGQRGEGARPDHGGVLPTTSMCALTSDARACFPLLLTLAGAALLALTILIKRRGGRGGGLKDVSIPCGGVCRQGPGLPGVVAGVVRSWTVRHVMVCLIVQIDRCDRGSRHRRITGRAWRDLGGSHPMAGESSKISEGWNSKRCNR